MAAAAAIWSGGETGLIGLDVPGEGGDLCWGFSDPSPGRRF